MAYIGISRICEGVFIHSFERGVNVGAIEERVFPESVSRAPNVRQFTTGL